jgi:hypothetical protein
MKEVADLSLTRHYDVQEVEYLGEAGETKFLFF